MAQIHPISCILPPIYQVWRNFCVIRVPRDDIGMSAPARFRAGFVEGSEEALTVGVILIKNTRVGAKFGKIRVW